MKHTLRLTASALLLGGALGACSTANDKPYAHESAQRSTATGQLPGASDDEPVGAAKGSLAATASPRATPTSVPQTVGMVAPSDARFVQDMTIGSVVEIELARIAYVRAQSPKVRAFARRMLIDHRDMVAKLDNFALERGHLVNWTLPQDRAGTIQHLRAIDDASFDRSYMDEMVEAHEKTVSKLQVQTGSARETAVIATGALPTVQHHLEMAQQIRAAL